MTLTHYALALRKSWVIIVLLTLLGATAGYVYGALQPDTYRAESAVVIVPARGDSTLELVQGANYVQGLVATYTVLATSPVVLDRVIDSLDLDTTPRALGGRITVNSPLDTSVLEIAVTGSNPQEIAGIANQVATELAEAVESLSPRAAAESSAAVRVETISPAVAPSVAIAPNMRLLVVVGALGGLVVGCIVAILRDLLATRLTSRADIAEVTDLPMIGEIPFVGSGMSLPTAVRTSSTGFAAEAVRAIAAGLRFANVDGEVRTILVTSAEASEGKSSVSLALAQIFAEQGQQVLVVDADLRRGSIAELTGLEGGVGLTTVLVGDVSEDDAVDRWAYPNLSVLTSGAVPPNPSQLLASEHARALLAGARERYDVVIVDSPPVLAVSDALWLAPAADGILIVTRSKRTRRKALARTISSLESARTQILGLTLNGTKRKASGPYYSAASTTPAEPADAFEWSRRVH